jgi:hypothetical protein
MVGKEIKARTRIKCPLCGALAWQSCFEKEKPLLKLFTQWSPGFRQIKYQENVQRDMLQGLHLYLIKRIEDLYKKLTGIDIQKLISEKGGEKEWQRLRSVSTVPVSTIGWTKTENLWSKENQNAKETGYHQKVLTKNLMK